MIEIKPYEERDQKEIIELVLHCQNDGSRPYMDIGNQPDLLQIYKEYINPGGNFWVAKTDGKVVGSIGLMKYGGGIAVLKKFFVYEEFRGAPHHLGRRLHETLLAFAKAGGISQIVLDTPKNTDRAHSFYEKAGYRKISKDELPVAYEYPYKDSDFFLLTL